VPFAVFSANINMFPMPGMPPVGPGLAPAANDAEREMHGAVAGWFAGEMAARLPVLNAARAGLGLAPLADGFDQPGRAVLHLLATSRAFDFPVPTLPPYLRYVGPLLDPPVWAGAWASPWAADDARPLVLVAMSTTFQDQVPAIRRTVAAARDLGARVLVTLGPALADIGLDGDEAVSVVTAAPHDAVMRQAALVVTHAGHGTVMRALAHGRPMLCLPMGRDQNDNAARVAHHGAGLRLAADAPDDALRDALARLLREPAFTAAATTIGAAIRTAEPPDALVAALEVAACGTACRKAA
jgi:UDP:flavonoid glycosyltransferase YjiC (YdhE family)